MSELMTEIKKRDVLRMSNEASNKLTKECLQMALIYLLNEKPIEKITITELVKRSGVSRTSFYRNYSSKEDIIIEMEEQICQAISKSLSSPDYQDNLRQWFLDCFQAVKDNASLFHLFLQTNIAQETLKGLNSILESFHHPQTIKEHYQILAIEGAFSSILTDWFINGMKEEVSFMADICESLIHGKTLQNLTEP